MSQAPKSSILLPLYIYPHPGAWDLLHSTIATNSTLHFIIILNPNSGPGAPSWWPNGDYVREIPKLNAQANVKTLGYIATSYCQRDIANVFADIETYAGWSKDGGVEGLSVDGIFFDETPNLFSTEVKEYLDAISLRAKDIDGILGDKLVVHNPGTAVDPRLADPGPDVTTVVEESFANFQKPKYQNWLSISPYDRSRSCYMVHSVPEDEVEKFTYEMRARAMYIFVTDSNIDYYHGFGKSWTRVIAALSQE